MVPGNFETAVFDLESSKLGSSGHINYDSLGGTIRVVNEDRSDEGPASPTLVFTAMAKTLSHS